MKVAVITDVVNKFKRLFTKNEIECEFCKLKLHRPVRALASILGKAIKFVTGNLD